MLLDQVFLGMLILTCMELITESLLLIELCPQNSQSSIRAYFKKLKKKLLKWARVVWEVFFPEFFRQFGKIINNIHVAL